MRVLFELTMPATTSPPTVPWDPIELTANRDINDNCSGVIPDIPPDPGNRHTGVVSTGVLAGVTTLCCRVNNIFDIRYTFRR